MPERASRARSKSEIVRMTIDVPRKKPRLAWVGMHQREEAKPVQTEIIEIVDPSHMTVYEGTRLLYAHPPNPEKFE